MKTPLTPAPLQVVCGPIEQVEADWLVVPWYQNEPDEALAACDAATGGQLAAARAAGEWKGKLFDLLATPVFDRTWRARKVVVVAGGPASESSPAIARRLASAAVLQARERGAARVAFLHRVPPGSTSGAAPAEWVQAEAEGLTLAEFDPGRYKSPADPSRASLALSIVVPDECGSRAVVEAAARRGRDLAQCANLARELTNEPGNALPPQALAERAKEMAAGTRLTVEVFNEQAIAGLGMGLLSAVGQGSRQPPRLIVITHQPSKPATDRVLGLVGKGVTFDSGGLSIKAAEGMERMKDDMAGGAAVMAAMRGISLLDLPIRVVGVIPSAENMPGGGALRPGDVVRSASGRTVEVVNTDAEGRLLLGDGLWFARQRGATHLVDVATLTGACMVALGRLTAGVFGRPDGWRDQVLEAARRSGEPCWPLPLVEDEREQLESQIADTVNSAGRYGAAITAAMFVGEFAGGLPWVHIDVAGPAWLTEARRDMGKGPTAFGVRSLVALAESLCREA
jgi:leucyl aminopeptidase